MKKINLITLLFASLLVFYGCGSKEKKSSFTSTFPPMEVEIPAELQSNPEAVEYIHTMSKAVDAYAQALDKVAMEFHKMGLKEGEEPSMMQKIKLMQILGTHFQDIAKSAEPLTMNLEKSNFMKGEMTDEEIVAFSLVMERFQVRMMEMEEKYQQIGTLAEE